MIPEQIEHCATVVHVYMYSPIAIHLVSKYMASYIICHQWSHKLSVSTCKATCENKTFDGTAVWFKWFVPLFAKASRDSPLVYIANSTRISTFWCMPYLYVDQQPSRCSITLEEYTNISWRWRKSDQRWSCEGNIIFSQYVLLKVTDIYVHYGVYAIYVWE